MPALAGTALLNKLVESSAEKVRFIPKNGGDPVKAKIVEIFVGKKKKDGKEGARVIPLEGDYEDGKVYFIPADRLKGMQGRQPGFSPSKRESPETESPAPAPKKGAAKTEKKVMKAPANDEAFDLTSALEEAKDLAEVAQDLAERLASLVAFYENLEMGDGETNGEAEAESPAPAPKKGSSKAKAGKGSSKPRHDDEDEA